MAEQKTNWQEVESRVFMTTGRRLPIVLVRGEGTRVWDEEGKAYLDFFGGPAVVSLGHCHPVLVDAITDQAKTLIQVSNLVYSVPQLKLAQLLVEHSCCDRVYFANSGAEANEAALKLARKWGHEKRDGAFEVIATLDSFHGRTLATITAGGTDRYKQPFAPLPPGFVHVPYNDIEALKQATNARTCAILLEPIQGEGGVNVPDDDYLPAVRRWCDEQNVLLILDEVQTGIGRCGALFAYELSGIEPDVITLAKGIASGIPLAAVLSKEHCSVFTPGDHGSTYGGNPLATRAGYEVVRYIIENGIPAKVADDGLYLEQRLHSMEDRLGLVTGARGKGLMWAVALGQEAAAEVAAGCLKRGLIVNNVRPDAVRLLPPLTVTREELDEGLDILEQALIEAGGGPAK
ncbi:MAG: aspartate aminotransferase family protein [Chloroflexi bacterium]|nr:aspartate aminotransferase family protein [Chloroflexota bacterium]